MTETDKNNDSSGIIPGTFEGMNAYFSSFEQVSTSERHLVWKANRYNRWWILKGLAPEANTEANRAALRKEFEIMMRLPADGFPQAFSLEEVAGHGPCIIMEYIEGKTLNEWFETKPTKSKRREIAYSLMDIVGRLHSCGIVSRDIKPSNIIISKLSGLPVLIDFDLADTNQHTAFKQPGGTAGYISPEQAVDFMPDRRNDIYSLAKVVLEMRPPLIWRPTLRRCLKNIEHRVPDAMLLRKRLTTLSLLLRIAVIGSILIVGYFAIVALLPKQTVHRVERITKVVTLPADTHKIDSLNNELSLIRAKEDSTRIAKERRQQMVQEECRKACKWIARQFQAEYEAHPDFLNPESQNMGEAIGRIMNGYDSIQHELRKRLKPSEYVVVESEMVRTYTENHEKWQKKTRMK